MAKIKTSRGVIKRIFCTRINYLRLNILGGIHLPVGIIRPQQRGDTGYCRSGHGGTVQDGIFVARPAGRNRLADSIDLIFDRIIRIVVVVRKGGNDTAVVIGAHNADYIGERRRVSYLFVQTTPTVQIIAGAVVSGSGNQNAGIVCALKSVLHRQ